jgi:4-methyl-5(b-hydroxyethyl)-thiazole monophosphate biosynthesis
MKVGILVCDGCAQFEVVLAAFFVQQRGEVVTYGLEMRGSVRRRVSVEAGLPALRSRSWRRHAFIVPGDQPDHISDDAVLTEKLQPMNARGKLMAAICAAPIHFSRAGLLEGRSFTS